MVLSIKAETIKFLEENADEYIHNLGLSTFLFTEDSNAVNINE